MKRTHTNTNAYLWSNRMYVHACKSGTQICCGFFSNFITCSSQQCLVSHFLHCLAFASFTYNFIVRLINITAIETFITTGLCSDRLFLWPRPNLIINRKYKESRVYHFYCDSVIYHLTLNETNQDDTNLICVDVSSWWSSFLSLFYPLFCRSFAIRRLIKVCHQLSMWSVSSFVWA